MFLLFNFIFVWLFKNLQSATDMNSSLLEFYINQYFYKGYYGTKVVTKGALLLGHCLIIAKMIAKIIDTFE